MNLQPIYPPDIRGQRVACFRCGKSTPLADTPPSPTNQQGERAAMADLDGPAYRAYYCANCVDVIKGEAL